MARARDTLPAFVLVLAALVITVPAAPAADTPAVPVSLRDAAGNALPAGQLCISADRARAGASGGNAVASWTLDTVAEIYPELYQQISFGDTDHDGRNEAFLYVNDNGTFHYRILEEQGGNVYSDEYSGASLIPYATGDLDGDGKSEVIGQVGYKVYVYESADAASYPTQLVWTSPNISNVVGYTAIGDTDGDGRMEIIHSLNPFSGNSELFIFENTGDDTFAQVYHTVVGPGANGDKVIADLDGDGRTEIAFSGVEGNVYIYESAADNFWSRTWTTATALFNAYGAEGGRDTDGDGRPELFIFGNGPLGWETLIFEATGNNAFEEVADYGQDDGYIGLSCNALGNLDNVGGADYLMQGNAHFWVYSAIGPGQWQLVYLQDDPLGGYHFGLQMSDVNQNGKDEVFWDIETYIQYGWRALVLEHALDPAGIEDPAMPVAAAAGAGGALRIAPNPCRGTAALSIPLRLDAPAGRLDIFDPVGRLVTRRTLSGRLDRPILWQAGDLDPGVYLLRVLDASGTVVASARGTVLR